MIDEVKAKAESKQKIRRRARQTGGHQWRGRLERRRGRPTKRRTTTDGEHGGKRTREVDVVHGRASRLYLCT
jgi:hypothetical protein